ncbi:NAD(P)-binding protein [Sparassis latifolia]|uniref:Uncharacterized oxidoreductase n=1 Tax=Sparassis crispa TaxID=139825 RepID=A0A401GE55_9APHY|nr:Uncharacterized oxidoreductase [Sparassis crispa]GBE80447.1 Uncharacterized oxidoreductase [Sparassis crispa]
MGSAFSALDAWLNFSNTLTVVRQSFPPKPTFSTDQIPDLTGQVIIVTGGNTGLGKEVITRLLEHNAKVYLAARSKEKADAAIKDLKELTGKEAIFLMLDLTSFASVRRAAAEFLGKEKELHVLFNNAGVMASPISFLTVEGYDMQFGTNVIGHYLFTKLLIPALVAGKDTSPDYHARIIHTSSSAAYLSTMDFDTFVPGPARLKLSPTSLYAQSKFANVVVSRQFAKRYADQGIVSIAVDPGNIRTDVLRNYGFFLQKLWDLLLSPVDLGALTQLYAGTMPEAVNHNGKFLIPYARVGVCRKEAYDDALGECLWNWLEEEVASK